MCYGRSITLIAFPISWTGSFSSHGQTEEFLSLVSSCLLLPPDRPFRNFRATAKCMQLRNDGFRGTEIVKRVGRVPYLGVVVSGCLPGDEAESVSGDGAGRSGGH